MLSAIAGREQVAARLRRPLYDWYMQKIVPVLLTVAALLFAACGQAGPAEAPPDLDPVAFLGTLPTPAEFEQSNNATAATEDDIQRIFAQGIVDREAARRYTSIGFRDAAVRSWTSGDRTLTVIASRWDNHQTAQNVGGGAAEAIPLSQGAQAWTPRSIRGARGTTTSGGSPHTALAVAIGDVSVVILAEGDDLRPQVERTMSLAVAALGI